MLDPIDSRIVAAPRCFARAAALFSTAAVGLLIAHELDYRFVVPDPAHRHDLLLRTGHGYLSHALVFLVAAGVIAAATALALGMAGARTRAPVARRRVALRLWAVQAGGFVLLEAIERLVVGAPPDDRLLLITLIGIAVQAATAFAGAGLLALLHRAGRALAALLAPWPKTAHASAGPLPAAPRERPILHRPSRAHLVRGPPSLPVTL